ncbi:MULTISPECIES: glutaredoxin 3 [unclassified Pseudomonas]|uniref:glutaredoxin 3 n=1 Tax=unclassified Pseudomonas TaxID=196821 RepID=UPI002AC8F115|nr:MULTISPECIES: glutaredoxin 3 [unclassified Pseudomonas]MEB0043321.1 glutaredoxin 3 [Pseudomonas sp. MH10]MEB0077496.1 glutaredoxin 3 [Pseudomonas sp. MH10out]MEB0090255.1 glutaredoxin 3 [Pseudomonas sp. CCI4.2]MEB0102597.1 glutaredoxin 3 [Pseudomonas sp. CCI3.2]MEB0119380.1 glutaredoxin 3 [Pseudomonas sp. CCI1.2]
MTTVTLYTTSTCPYCRNAKSLLANKGVEVQEFNIEFDSARRKEMMALSGRRSVPQIFIGDHHVGGFDDLALLDRQGGLMALLA